MKISPGEKIGAVGTFQTGKTTCMRHILEQFSRALVWDPEAEFRGGPWRVVSSWDQLPPRLEPGHYAFTMGPRRFDDWAGLAQETSGWAVFADEFQSILSSPSATGIPQNFDRLWRTAHKRSTSVMWATHRLNEVPPILRNTHHLLIFPQDREHDWRDVADEAGQEAAQRLRESPDYCYLHLPTGGRDPRLCPPVQKP